MGRIRLVLTTFYGAMPQEVHLDDGVLGGGLYQAYARLKAGRRTAAAPRRAHGSYPFVFGPDEDALLRCDQTLRAQGLVDGTVLLAVMALERLDLGCACTPLALEADDPAIAFRACDL